MNFRHQIKIAKIDAFPIRAAGGVSPKMALGSMPTRPALLVRIEDDNGCFGWGEIWANFPTRANIHKAHIVEDVIAGHLQNLIFVEPLEVQTKLRDALGIYFLHVGQLHVFEHILAGLDIAIWDLALRNSGHSFKEFMGVEKTSIPTYASSINANDIDKLIPMHTKIGQKHFKLKIGFSEHESKEILAKASSFCPPNASIMIDSNQSWTLNEAKKNLAEIEEFNPFFAEEPIPANSPLSDWEALAYSTSIPIAGGENIYGIDSFLSMANVGMTYLQPDAAKWGGVSGALELAEKLPAGVKLWPHFMGTAVGQMAALSITAAVGADSICEVDVNKNALRSELCGNVIDITNGEIKLSENAGLVVPPENKKIQTYLELDWKQ